MTNLSDDEIKTLTGLLKKLSPGFLPLEVFTEFARLYVSSIVEIVPVRKVKSQVQVLLLKRPNDDPIWPGMHHTPGTVVRATDKSYADCFERILTKELQKVKTTEPVFVFPLLHKVKRGVESSLVYWVEVLEPPKTGEFFDTNKLPKNIIDTQIEFIRRAEKDFKLKNN